MAKCGGNFWGVDMIAAYSWARWASVTSLACVLGLATLSASASEGVRGWFGLDAASGQSCADWSRKVERLERRAERRSTLPPATIANTAYGPTPREVLDVYRPTRLSAAPMVVVMVHGGGWCVGDKRMDAVVRHKQTHWVGQGHVFVSINYPMVGQGHDALAQAGFVAKAVAWVQQQAPGWGVASTRVVLVGHSAGGHLVSLVNASGPLKAVHGMKPVLGVVSLDAGAIDVVRQMPQVYRFLKARYAEAFGTSEAQWVAASPFHQLDATASPWLGVCSTQRRDDPCGQARAYVSKSQTLGVTASVLPLDLAHDEINERLGQPGDYTRAVDAFIAAAMR